VLGAFGGAGPFSICAVADAVGVKRVLVPSMAAVFSASGIGGSDIGHRYDDMLTGPEPAAAARARVEAMLTRARQDMFAEGFELARCQVEWTLREPDGTRRRPTTETVAAALGALKPGISVLDLVVSHPVGRDVAAAVDGAQRPAAQAPAQGSRRLRFGPDGEVQVPVHVVDDLVPGMTGAGPAIVEDPYFTLPVPRGWTFTVTAAGDFQLDRR
jgi:N-methylhydantoinase A/oxoprolinase/acetone carboxylase beta subunit